MATGFLVIFWPFLVAAVILWCSYRADTAPFRKTRSAPDKRSKLHGEILDLKMRLNTAESDNRVLQLRHDALNAALAASLKRDLRKAQESSKSNAGIDFDDLLEIGRQPKKVSTPSGRCWCKACQPEAHQHSYKTPFEECEQCRPAPEEEPEPPVFFADGLQVTRTTEGRWPVTQTPAPKLSRDGSRRTTVEPPSSDAIDSRWIEPPGRKPWLEHEGP